mgnify:CR=1 FL=1
MAARLLDIPGLDALVAEEVAFNDTPRELPRADVIQERLGAPGLAPVIRYPQA